MSWRIKENKLCRPEGGLQQRTSGKEGEHMSLSNPENRHYCKPGIKKEGNVKDITFGVPAWQFSCGGDSHGSHGVGNGYGHCKAQGRGHQK